MTTKADIPNAGELMNRSVHCVSPNMMLAELIEFLLNDKISCAPVTEERNHHKFLVGFISESDALEYLSNEMFFGSPRPQQTVQTCMKRHPVSVTADIDAFTLASLFVNHGYRHMPVVDSDNHLLGIVSRREILKALQKYYSRETKDHDFEHFPPDLTKIINHRFILSK